MKELILAVMAGLAVYYLFFSDTRTFQVTPSENPVTEATENADGLNERQRRQKKILDRIEADE